MGYSRWSPSDWSSYSTTTTTKARSAIFTSRGLHDDMDPKKALVRESRDSAANPLSTAIIVALDETGSMGTIPEYMIKTGLGVLFGEIYDRKPVTDPHVMMMAMGDVKSDSAPFQVGQFEADLSITSWLEKVYLEGNGGGNDSESYDLPLWFAANRTSIDCFEKRNKKGYLFTIGDEFPREQTTADDLERVFGEKFQGGTTLDQLYEAASRMYHVFHIIVNQGGVAGRYPDRVKTAWQKYYGQNALPLDDYTKLSEVIVSAIQVVEGADAASVSSSWTGDTSIVVHNAVKGLKSGTLSTVTKPKGVVKF